MKQSFRMVPENEITVSTALLGDAVELEVVAEGLPKHNFVNLVRHAGSIRFRRLELRGKLDSGQASSSFGQWQWGFGRFGI